MSTNASLPLLYALYRLINPPLPTPLDYVPIIFRLLAISIAAPFLFITLLEVAGYLVVRTLGFTTRLPGTSSAPPSTVPSGAASPTTEKPGLPLAAGVQPVPVPPLEKAISDAHRQLAPPQIVIPPLSPLRGPEKYDSYFATPGEHDFKLSGTGLFSPPDSREGSPPRSVSGRSSALGLGGVEVEVRSRPPGMNGLKALTPVEAR